MTVNNSESSSCTNCGAPLPPSASWCTSCGQKVYKGPPSFGQLIGEFLETVFNLDNRLFRTLAALAVPGRLTNNFLAGKQKPYFHPLRLFFISGVLMVGAYSLFLTQSIEDSLAKENEAKRSAAYESRYGELLSNAIDSIRASYPSTEVTAASDSLFKLLGFARSDSFNINYLKYQGGFSFTSASVNFLREDFIILTPNELLDLAKIEGLINRYEVQQIIRVNRLETSYVGAMMGQTIWGLLLLVPISAGLLKGIYVRRKRKYIEHFVFSLNTHAFLFITQFLAALEFVLFGTPYLCILSGVAIPIYFYLALKRVYRQGWFKTAVKAGILGFCYLMVIPVAIAVSAVIAVLLF
ncbi:MAG: DUF3667 domain-containing protein [Bacteroidota bacterium]